MKFIGYTVVTVAICAAASIYSGFVLSILWGWFIVPTFSFPPLNIPSAIGIAIVAGYLTGSTPKREKDDTPYSEVLIWGASWSIVKPTMALFVGSIVSHWM